MREHGTSEPKADYIEEHTHAIRLIVDGYLLKRTVGFSHSHDGATPEHTHQCATVEWLTA